MEDEGIQTAADDMPSKDGAGAEGLLAINQTEAGNPFQGDI